MHLKYLVTQDPASFPQSFSSLLAAASYRDFVRRLRAAFVQASELPDPQPEAAEDPRKMPTGKPRKELAVQGTMQPPVPTGQQTSTRGIGSVSIGVGHARMPYRDGGMGIAGSPLGRVPVP